MAAAGNEGVQALMEGVAHNETLRVLDIMDNPQSIVPVEVVERGTAAPKTLDEVDPENPESLFVFQDRALQAGVDGGKDVDEALEERAAAGVHDTRLALRPNMDRRGAAVAEFMREVGDEADAQRLRRIKWFLVGRGEAGKTSLFRALRDPSAAKLTDKLDRTVLIDVHEVGAGSRRTAHLVVVVGSSCKAHPPDVPFRSTAKMDV